MCMLIVFSAFHLQNRCETEHSYYISLKQYKTRFTSTWSSMSLSTRSQARGDRVWNFPMQVYGDWDNFKRELLFPVRGNSIARIKTAAQGQKLCLVSDLNQSQSPRSGKSKTAKYIQNYWFPLIHNSSLVEGFWSFCFTATVVRGKNNVACELQE